MDGKFVDDVAGRYAPWEGVISSRVVAMTTTSLYPVQPEQLRGHQARISQGRDERRV